MKVFASILALFVTAPIWFYLQYKILVIVNATELMFFLYWVYVPVSVVVNVAFKFLENKE